jgi:carboxymethylenebutenolidase
VVQPATTAPAGVKPPPPADKENGALVAAALKNTTRHGEWKDIEMPGSTTKIKAWVVHPERADKAPVVLVIHEIFGMQDWVRAVADNLAANGFIAVAPDFLSGMGPNGGGTESLGNNVGQTIRTIDADKQVKILDAAREWAIKLPNATDKVGTVGFCWGGGVSFTYAARQPKLNAAAVYYGSPPANGELSKINAPVLGCYGGNDARITATVEPTKKAMEELKKPYDPHVYEGAGHGFLRQQGTAANQKAADEAWPTTIAFFKKNLE